MKKGCFIYRAMLIAIPMVIICLSGCTRRTLLQYPDEAIVKIELEWGVNSKPASTGFIFYDEKGGDPIYREGTTEGFEGPVPSGTYRVVVMNTDVVNAKYNPMGDFENDYFTAQQLSPARNGTYIKNVYNVYGAGIDELSVPRYSDEPIVRRVSPTSLVRRITCILDIGAIRGIEALDVVLTGALTNKRVVSNTPYTGSSAYLTGRALYDSEHRNLETQLSAFDFVGPCILSANAIFEDGSVIPTNEVDLTEQILSNPASDLIVYVTLVLEEIGEIGVTVRIHGWKNGGSGSGVVE